MKCLIFDISGDYGHFRKFYTTSSPLTFSIPPRTAVAGIIAAIIGLDKEDYLSHFSKEKANIAIKINNPVKKTRVSYNLINTKNAKLFSQIKDRTQVTFELLKNPSFRIYINHSDDKIYSRLKMFLEEQSNYYTVSLGLSEFIAEFKYIGESDFEFIENDNQNIEISTIIPFSDDIDIEIEVGKEYFKDVVPNEMGTDRVVTEYRKVLFERNGLSVKGKINHYKNEDGVNIVFL